jgi:hypothetical protein
VDKVELYWRIIKVIEHFLKSSRSNLSVEALKELDPTIEQVAEDLRMLAGIFNVLAVAGSYEDTNMALNALQCVNVMERLVIAVSDGKQDDLESIIKELEVHVNVP